MKRALMIGVGALIAGVVGFGAVYGPDIVNGMQYEAAMQHIGEAKRADVGPWSQPQETCFFCHGQHGQSSNAWYPSLAGQPEAYVIAQLHAFASGQRHHANMEPLARNLSEQQIEALGAYFAKQTPAQTEAVSADPALIRQGAALVQAKSCQACHGAGLMGKDLIPRLAGQGESYLAQQLTAFRTGARHDPSGAMNAMAASLSDHDIGEIAGYLAGIVPTTK